MTALLSYKLQSRFDNSNGLLPGQIFVRRERELYVKLCYIYRTWHWRKERKKGRKKQVSDSLSFHSLRSPSSERHQLDSGQWMKTGLFSDDLPITICNVAFPSMES